MRSISLVVAVVLSGCGGGLEELFGDGGSRAVVKGQIMGQERTVCFDNVPTVSSDDPQAARKLNDLHDVILAGVQKLVRFDSGVRINNELQSDRSCAYKLSPYLTYDYSKLGGVGDLQQLADWGNVVALTTAQGERYVNVCVRDTQCEDGDVLRVTLNGTGIFETEIVNAARCGAVAVPSGRSYLGVLAVNGTGFKGSCNFADRNTGEVTVSGATGGALVQTYNVPGGAGSYGELMIVN